MGVSCSSASLVGYAIKYLAVDIGFLIFQPIINCGCFIEDGAVLVNPLYFIFHLSAGITSTDLSQSSDMLPQ